MKSKLIIAVLIIIVLYMIVPLGDYGLDDVNIYYDSNYNSSFKFTSSTSDWITKVKNNIRHDTGYIVYPSTGIARDGNQDNLDASLILTSGWVRSGSYDNGAIHGAIDTDITGYTSLGKCPSGHTDCDDTILISPISGKVTEVLNTKGSEAASWNNNKWESTSRIKIEATDEFKGWSVRIMHMSNIPTSITVDTVIKQGDFIGTQCSQGQSTGSHVHMEVFNGNSKVHIKEWFPKISLHSSIGRIIDDLKDVSVNLKGFETDVVDVIETNPRYESTVDIPEDVLVSN